MGRRGVVRAIALAEALLGVSGTSTIYFPREEAMALETHIAGQKEKVVKQRERQRV